MKGLIRLQKGDKIGIYSPSSPITYSSPKRFGRAKSFLETKGFEIIEGNLTGTHDFYRSGNILERAEELNELIRNPDIRCIMSTIGGTNSNAILPYIDYEAFKRNPKIMIGYSDATAIVLAIYAQTGIPTFYGPALVPSFGEFEPYVNYTYDYFQDILIKEQQIPFTIPLPPYWTDEPLNWELKTEDKQLRTNEWICVNEGTAEGRLIGGNLNAMYGIWGSPYMPVINEGDILLIEDTMKSASVVEKNFNLLKLNGVFERVSGIILGKHELFDDQGTGRKPADILVETIGNTTIPILADFDCCHTHPMLTMPIGQSIKMVSGKKRDCTNGAVDKLKKEIEAVFIDRDGTIGGTGHFIHPHDFVPYSFSKEAIQLLQTQGIKVFGFTNQHRVSRGEATIVEFQKEFLSYGFVDGFICPHSLLDYCVCRKPSPGMLLEAASKHNVDLKKCVVIGDVGGTDMLAAHAVGAMKILVLTGWGQGSLSQYREEWKEVEPDYIAENLLEAVKWLMQ